MEEEIISSLRNPKVKRIVSLRKPSCRRQSRQFLIDGWRELKLAVSTRVSLLEAFICPEIFARQADIKELETMANNQKIKLARISRNVYEKIAYGDRQEGVVGVACQKEFFLSGLLLPKNPLLVVAESVEKPGNLGAMMRTADAAGVTGFIICQPRMDIYNPNLIRSSLGALFTLPIAIASSDEAITWLKANRIKIVCAVTDGNIEYTDVDYRQPLAITLGSEDAGLGRVWLKNADYLAKIKMKGMADSLNVSVAGAIFLFEALRQRKWNYEG